MGSPQRAAKPYKGVAFVFLAIVVILMTGYLLFLWATGSLLPPMTEARARKLVQEAGGADEISREAANLISSFKTSEVGAVKTISIYDSTITNYPALSLLLTNSHTRGALIEPHSYELPRTSELCTDHTCTLNSCTLSAVQMDWTSTSSIPMFSFLRTYFSRND